MIQPAQATPSNSNLNSKSVLASLVFERLKRQLGVSNHGLSQQDVAVFHDLNYPTILPELKYTTKLPISGLMPLQFVKIWTIPLYFFGQQCPYLSQSRWRSVGSDERTIGRSRDCIPASRAPGQAATIQRTTIELAEAAPLSLWRGKKSMSLMRPNWTELNRTKVKIGLKCCCAVEELEIMDDELAALDRCLPCVNPRAAMQC
jgi:hypothetical protein